MGGASVSVGVVLGSSPRRNPLPFPSTVIPFQLQARVSPLVHASRLRLLCNSTSSPGGPPPGENDSRQVLDAFFLGKAVAEALTERIESTVGEFLSTIGRLQAEQQKQVQDFQEEVLEKAKKAKEKAAKEAMEEQGLVPTENPSPIFASDSYKVTPVSDPAVSTQGEEASGGEEPLLGGPTDHMRDE